MSKNEHIKLSSGLEGFLFLPDSSCQPIGCMIIFHERYGLVKHTLDLAEKLADDGYITLAPDLFSLWSGDKEALKRGDVRATISDDECAGQIDSWIDYLRSSVLDPENNKIALMGVCQSGRYPIVVGSQRDDLTACVVFYGATQRRDWGVDEFQPRSMPEMIGDLNVPLFFVFGEKDHIISIADVRKLRDRLEEVDLSYKMEIVADAPHGFLNDTMPGRYRPDETEQAWALLVQFLNEVFVEGWPHGRVIWRFNSSKAINYDFGKNVRLE